MAKSKQEILNERMQNTPLSKTKQQILAERGLISKTGFNENRSRISDEEHKQNQYNLGRTQQDLAQGTEALNSFAVDDVSDYQRRDAIQQNVSALEKENTVNSRKVGDAEIVNRVIREDVKGKGVIDTASANAGVGQFQQDSSLAWNDYINSQSPEAKRSAEIIDQAAEYYRLKQQDALYDQDNEGNLIERGNIITKDFMQYVPQLADQIQAQIPAQLAALAVGAVSGGALYQPAARILNMAASAKQSFDVMRGSAYKSLKDLGVSEELALTASRDEALINAMIEGIGSGIGFEALGFGKLANMIKGLGVKKVVSELAKEGAEQAAQSSLAKVGRILAGYGINILSEAAEEAAQEFVSIKNEQRTLPKEGIERTATAEEDRQRIIESAKGGAKIAAVMGGPALITTTGGQYLAKRNTEKRVKAFENAVKTAPSEKEARTIGVEAKKDMLVQSFESEELADVFRALGDEGSRVYREAVLANPSDEKNIRERLIKAYSTGLSTEKSFDEMQESVGITDDTNQAKSFFDAAQKDVLNIQEAAAKVWSETQETVRAQRSEFIAKAEPGLFADEYANNLAKPVQKTLNAFGKALKSKIVIAPGVGSVEGRAVVDAAESAGFRPENGFYDAKTRTIYLNADLKNKTLATALHEVTHSIQTIAPAEYEQYKSFAMPIVEKIYGKDYISRYIAFAKNHNVNLTEEMAKDEAVSNLIMNASMDPVTLRQALGDKVSFGERVVSAFQNVLNQIEKMIVSNREFTREELNEMKETEKQLRSAANLWKKAMVEAKKAAKDVQTTLQNDIETDVDDDSILDSGIQFSIREGEAPKKTIIAYKAFRVKTSQKGELFPLFVNANEATPTSLWVNADIGDNTKTRLGQLAPRPGWHLGDKPRATHIGKKGPDGKINRQHKDVVWCECEVAADVDWQKEANKNGLNKKGILIPKNAEIRDRIPADGYYRYKTNPNMEGEWIIAGAIKVLRVLTDAEVDKIQEDLGLTPIPRDGGPIDLTKYGFAADGRFNTGETRFSMREPVESNKDLIAIHNLSSDKLLASIELGGFVVPSIAILKAADGHTGYGDISILFGKESIDPKKNKSNSVYGGDAWTPTFPQAVYKLNENAVSEIVKKVKTLLDKGFRETFKDGIDYDNMTDRVNRSGSFVNAYRESDLLKATFLNDIGVGFKTATKIKDYQGYTGKELTEIAEALPKDVIVRHIPFEKYEEVEPIIREVFNKQWREKNPKSYYKELFSSPLPFSRVDNIIGSIFEYQSEGEKTVIDYHETRKNVIAEADKHDFIGWLEALGRDVIEKKGIRNSADFFTRSGNRRSWEALHDEFNAKNVLKVMLAQSETGLSLFSGFNRFKALSNKKYTSISEIKKESARLQKFTEDEYDALQKGYSDRYMDILGQFINPKASNPFTESSGVADLLCDSLEQTKNPDRLMKYFNQYNKRKMTLAEAEEIIEFSKEVASIPTQYFEAKPRRIVEVAEIKAAVIPDNVDSKVVKFLVENDIKNVTYKAGDDADRIAKTNSIEEVKFSLRDSEGRELTEAQAEFFKDSKVRDEQGNLLRVYHGTAEFGFTVFNHGSYFTNSKNLANVFAKREGSNKQVYEVYLNLLNPLIIDAEGAFWDEVYAEVDGKDFDEIYEEVYGFSPSEAEDGEDVVGMSIEDWRYYATNEQYDGLIVLNAEEENGEVANQYIAFSPSQIKSIDNLNPTGDDDIRYSLRDSEGATLTPQQAEFFKDSKVRDEEGNLKVMYHSSNSKEINIFQSGNSAGLIYFSESVINSKKAARGNKYTNPYYLNITNPSNTPETPANWYEAEDNIKINQLKGKNFDGIYVKDEGGISLAAFYPSQIKSIDNLNPTSDDDIRYSLRDGTPISPFYSKLARTIEQSKQEVFAADSFIKFLLSSGVTKDEVYWLDVEGFLKGKKSVRKADILDYLKQNNLEIEITVQDNRSIDPNEYYDEVIKDSRLEFNSLKKNLEPIWNQIHHQPYPTKLSEVDFDSFVSDLFQKSKASFSEILNNEFKKPRDSFFSEGGFDLYREKFLLYYRAVQPIEDLERLIKNAKKRADTATQRGEKVYIGNARFYKKYSMEGDNYREILLKFPVNKYGSVMGHWDEKNTFAHARVTDAKSQTTNQDGEAQSESTVLFLEEVQSDWHEKGRDFGYYQPTDSDATLKNSYDELETTKAPDAPFKETWHEVVLKRMLREAAENGYDYMAWAPGHIHNKRYSLEHQVSQIKASSWGDGTYTTFVLDKSGQEIKLLTDIGWKKGDLKRRFGSALGNKIATMADEKRAETGERTFVFIEGDDIRIGGEGMRNFYDVGGKSSQNIPSFLSKYVKQWGSKVEEIEVDKVGLVPAIRITESMKDSVLTEGQPLFMLRETGELEKEMKQLKRQHDIFKRRYEYFKKQLQLSKQRPDKAKVQALAKKLLAEQQSTMDEDTLANGLMEVYEALYQSNTKKSDTAAREYAETLANEMAKEVLANYSESITFENEVANEIRTMLRSIRIIPTDIAKEDLDPIKRKYKRIKWAKPEESSKPNVFDLFTAYEMFAERFPDIFDAAEDQPQDMLDRIIEATEASEVLTGGLNDMDISEFAPELTMRILDAFDEVIEDKTFADRQKELRLEAVEKAKREAREAAMQEASAQFGSEVDSIIKDAEQQIKDAELRAQAAEKAAEERVEREWRDAQSRSVKEAEDAISAEVESRVRYFERKAQEQIKKEKLKAEAKILRERKLMKKRIEQEKAKKKIPNDLAVKRFMDSMEITSIRKNVYKQLKSLNKAVYDPTDKQHIPPDMEQMIVKIEKVLRADKGKMPLTEEERIVLLEAANYFNGLDSDKKENGDTNENGDTFLIDTDLADNLLELSKILKNKSFTSMKKELKLDKYELTVYHDTLAALAAYLNHRNRTFGDGIRNELNRTGQAIANEIAFKSSIDAGDEKTELWPGYEKFESAILQAPRDLVSVDMLAPLDFAERLGPTFERLFKSSIRRGMDKKIKLLAEAQQYMEALIGKAKIEYWTGPKAELIKAFGLEMTPAQWMSLYVSARQDQARNHMRYGGVSPTDYVVKNGKRIAVVKRGYEPIPLTNSQIDAIAGLLSEEQQRIAEGVSYFFETRVAAWGNEVSEAMYGYKKFTVKNYFPIVSNKDFLNENIGEVNEKTLRNTGSTKKRINGANNPIYAEDIFDVYSKHVDIYSSYNAFVPGLTDLQRIYNLKVAQGSIKGVIAKRFGDRMQQYYKKLLLDINGGLRTEPESAIAGWLTSKYKSAVIGWNLRVVAQQPTSLVRASAMVDPKYLARGMVGKADWQIVMKYAPIAQWKEWGYFTLDVGRQLKNVMLGKENFIDKTMTMIEAADRFAWLRLWKAIEYEVADAQPNLKGEDFYKTVGLRFSDVIDRTQVVDTVLHRTGIMRGGALSKMITSFMSEPLKSFNLLSTAIRNYQENKTKANGNKVKRVFASWLVTMAVTGVARALMDLWREDEDDEGTFAERFFDKWFENVKYEPLGMFPYLKDIVSLVEGYSVDRMDTQLLEKLIRAVNRMDDGKYSIASRLYNMTSAIFDAFGIPLSSATREAGDLVRNVTKIFNFYEGEFVALALQYDIRNAANTTRFVDVLFKAHKAGDIEAYDKMLAELLNNGITIDSVRSRMVSHYKKVDDVPAEFAVKKSLTPKPEEEEERSFIGKIFDALNGVEPKKPEPEEEKKVTVESLNPKQSLDYSEQYRQYTEEILSGIEKTSAYRNGSEALKIKMENAALVYANSEALKEASGGKYIEETAWINQTNEAVSKANIDREEYIAFVEGRKDYGASIGASGVTQEETAAYMDRQGWNREQKAVVWAILYPKSQNPYK